MSKDEKKVVLIYPTPEGSREFALENGEFRLGRGDVDLRFDDGSLSRHHATIFREGERIWILDNNSTNGSFVNGVEVAPNGTILYEGDSIQLGNETRLTLQFVRQTAPVKQSDFSQNKTAANSVSASSSSSFNFIPLAIAGFAVLIIGLAIVVVASRAISSQEDTSIASASPQDSPDDEDPEDEEPQNKKKPTPGKSPEPGNANVSTSPEIIEEPKNSNKQIPVAPTKTYLQMSDAEQRAFIEKEAKLVARMIGNQSGDAVPPEAVERIKTFVDGYAKRLRSARKDSCEMGKWVTSDLETVIERASKNGHFIVPAFNSEGIAPQIGIYLAMIESEHCVCLQSPTGPLGMFQFATATAQSFGLKAVRGATPANPDERCDPEKAAPAAARYMKFLMGRYGTGSLSVPLAIASYNSGEGGLSKNLDMALEAESGNARSFWTLVANQGKLSEQFQKENIKYVPKFFAAAIIGENPTVFGVKKPPISSNTK